MNFEFQFIIFEIKNGNLVTRARKFRHLLHIAD